MQNAGRGATDERETVEDAAARILAGGFGPGVLWWADAQPLPLMTLDDQGIAHENENVIPVARETYTQEMAGRYFHRESQFWPQWFKQLPRIRRTQLLKWDEEHPLSTQRRDIGEFQIWERNATHGAAPRRDGSMRAAAALHDARLTGPLEPLLRLFALEEAHQWPVVLRFCRAEGLDIEACDAAIRRILFAPRTRKRIGVKERATQLGGDNEAFRKETKRAEYVLRGWLHRACSKFVGAHGWTPRVREVKPPSLKMPRRAMPRFRGGMDSWQIPGKTRTIHGERAAAYCRNHPSESPIPRFYLELNNRKIFDAHDLRGAERGREQRYLSPKTEIPCQGLFI